MASEAEDFEIEELKGGTVPRGEEVGRVGQLIACECRADFSADFVEAGCRRGEEMGEAPEEELGGVGVCSARPEIVSGVW